MTVSASVDFADAGADVVSLRLRTSAGADLSLPLGSLSGVRTGTAQGSFAVPTDAAGQYTFEVWLVDSTGTASTRIPGTFEVLAPDTDFHPPSIANLTSSPARVVQAAGSVAQIDLTLGFADTGADVAAARVAIYGGAELTLPTSLTGAKSGTLATSFAVPLATPGLYTFEIWLVDGRGSVSNRLVGMVEVVPTVATSTWTTLSVTPPAELLGIGWGGGQVVAVGRLGTVMTSTDLAAWTLRASGVNHTLRSVAMSGSRIVAVGDDTAGEAIVISSPDGITWAQRAPLALPISDDWTHPNQRWVTSVAWSGSLLVLPSVDRNWDPVVWSSPDATAWTPSSDLTNEVVWSMPFVDVAWGNGRFVAVDGPAFNGDSPVFTSVDGIRWRPDTTVANLPMMNAIAARPGEFVAVGATHLQTSQDGLNWTVFPLVGCGNAVLWDGARYVAVGSSICKSH